MCPSLILCWESPGEKVDCVGYSKSILAKIKGEDIDITSDIDNNENEDELQIL